MAGSVPAPTVLPAKGTAAQALVWRHGGRLYVTVIGKATFALLDGDRMKPIEPEPVREREVHHNNLPNRSIRYASDLAPKLALVDVVLTGFAFPAPKDGTDASVRLSILDGNRYLLDKRLHVAVRDGANRIPLVYERALGGIGHAQNPLGTADPTITDPSDPKAAAGFGPISRSIQARRKLLGKTPKKLLDAPVASYPDNFDFSYFQTAPPDQRIGELKGTEDLLVEGMTPDHLPLRSRLPRVRGLARIEGLSQAGIADGTEVALRADTLRIDMAERTCTVVLRKVLEAPSEAAISSARILVRVEPASLTYEDAKPRTASAPKAPRAGTGTVVMTPSDGTIELSDADFEATDVSVDLTDLEATIVKDKAPPDDDKTTEIGEEPSFADPQTAPLGDTLVTEGPAGRATLPFLKPFIDPPAKLVPEASKAPEIVDEETVGPDSAMLAMGAKKPLPFDPTAAPQLPEPEGERPYRQLADTLYLMPEEQVSAGAKDVLPFITTGATPPGAPPRKPPRGPRPVIPERTSDAIPVITTTTLIAWTLPWQVQTDREVRTVIVKGTFDLVEGAPATLCAETSSPSGDLHEGEDTSRDLLYPSDFAIFKPKADVTVRGHAHCPKRGASMMEVGLSFGRGALRIERRLAVMGERKWRGGAPTEPLPFDKIPLLYEYAYGGTDYPKNPIGRGRSIGWGRNNLLPNLEDRESLLKSPKDSPEPACLCPVPPRFQGRSSKLGTYGARWLKSRWPYFPEDFDWAYFQHAPPAQQVDFPRGDEPYRIHGVRPDGEVLSGKLGGLVPRVFAQRTTAAGGLFFEVLLRLDTVMFDADEEKLHLAWRGLFDTADAEASDIAELYLLSQRLTDAELSVSDAERRYHAERGPFPVIADTPSGARPANEVAPADKAAPGRSAGGRVAEKLQAAGIAASPAGSDAPFDAEPPTVSVRTGVRAEVEKRLSDSASLDGLDLNDADLSGLDFSGRSLAFAILTGASFAGAKLTRADLSGAVLAGADLSEADLKGAVLAGADLTGVVARRASFEETDLTAADFSDARAEQATFKKARGKSPRFVGALLEQARFDGAELPGADLTRTALSGAVFDGALAPEIRLYDARGAKASLESADLTGARADGAMLTDCSFKGAKAPGSVWDRATLERSSFSGSSLEGAGFSKAKCQKISFASATLTEARFDGANLKQASLKGANLMEASLESADLRDADLSGANLYSAATWRAKLRGAKLDKALTGRTKLAKEKR